MARLLIVFALLSGCAMVPENSVHQSARECMAFNGSPSYVVTGNTSKFDCRLP